MRHLKLCSAVLLLAGCQVFGDGEREAGKIARQWAEAYFNYDFREATRFVTPESEKWLHFAASNVTEQDIEILNATDERATINVGDYYVGTDTTGMISVTVNNFLSMDSIGHAGSRHESEVFILEVVKRNGHWKIRMAGLPRSEKQSHD